MGDLNHFWAIPSLFLINSSDSFGLFLIFLGVFQLSSDLNSLGADEIFQIEEKVEKILTETKSLKLAFLTKMSSELFGLIKMGAEKLKDNKKPINSILREMWIYLSLVSRANLSRIESKSEREKVIKAIKNLDLLI